MGAIDNFLRRFGFVRLDRFGLVLTPDERIVSTRPTVLDDGLGGKIVGWCDGDLAAMELETWVPMGGAPQPKKKQQPRPALPVASPPAARALPGLAPAPASVAVAAPVAAPVPAPAPVPVPAPAPAPVAVAAPPPQVAPAPQVEEDDWEWEIAVARARAEAADRESTAVTAPLPELLATCAQPQPQPQPSEPESWDEPAPKRPERAPKVTHQPLAAVPAPMRVQPSGKTIIPVPMLPVAADPRAVRPVVAPRRMPRATGRMEDTIQTRAAPPANEDRTSTQVSLPPAATTIGLPSSRRVAAKQR